MDLLPKRRDEFASAAYWEQFFKKRGAKAFEWYGEYPELCGTLHKYMKTNENILHIGCGNSSLGADLYDVGYKHVTNIDISGTVISSMKTQHEQRRPDLEFLQMDMCQMSFEDSSFHVVLDKGTLDAVLPDTSPETMATIDRMFSELSRVLRVGGRYVCITLAQRHILDTVLEYFPKCCWMTRICHIAQPDRSADHDFYMPSFAFVFTKFRALPNMTPILELAPFEEQLERLGSVEQLKAAVQQLQYVGVIKQQLNRGKQHVTGHLSFHLHAAGKAQPRYTLYVVDSQSAKKQKFAVFIVPLGREFDWLFRCHPGREALCEQAGFQRLLVVTLNRTHEYSGLDEVKDELSSKVMELAPSKVSHKEVPFLSMGSSLDERTVVDSGGTAQGDAQRTASGPWVVEDTVEDGGKTRRRLVLLDQPQAPLAQITLVKVSQKSKKRRGKGDTLTPEDSLADPHHVTMLAGMAFVGSMPALRDECLRVLVFGLRGGTLVSYLLRHFPKAKIQVLEEDPSQVEVATKSFHLPKQEPRLEIRTGDPVTSFNQLYDNGERYHVIMIDAPNYDVTKPVASPPVSLLQSEFLGKVESLLEKTGVLILRFDANSLAAATEDSGRNLLQETVQHLTTRFSVVFSTPEIPRDTNDKIGENSHVLFALPTERHSQTQSNTEVLKHVNANLRDLEQSLHKENVSSESDVMNLKSALEQLHIVSSNS